MATDKSVAELLENIKRSLPNRDLVKVPEGASLFEQLQILQQLASSDVSGRAGRTEHVRRSVRDEYAERDRKRGISPYQSVGEMLNDVEEKRREIRKKQLESQLSDRDLVAGLESLDRKRAIKERRKKLTERKSEYTATIGSNEPSSKDWKIKQEEKQRLRREIQERELIEAQSKIIREQKEAEREKRRVARQREEQRLVLEQEKRNQERQLRDMARWRADRARKFEEQDQKISEYQERLEKQRRELEKEKQKNIDEVRKERLARLHEIEKEREEDNKRIMQLEEEEKGRKETKVAKKEESFEVKDEAPMMKENKKTETVSSEKSKFKELDNIGGHGGILFGPTPGLIQKKLFSDMPDEVSFYESLKDRNLGEGRKFFPEYQGTCVIDGDLYVILEDLTFGKKHPSVLDLKIGRTTWQPNSPHEKRRKMEKKDADSTSSKIGARMIGFSRYIKTTGNMEKAERSVTKMVGLQDFQKYLSLYFHNGEGCRFDVVQAFIVKLEEMLAWWETQTSFALYSSSVLFIYDGSNTSPSVSLRVIDFAHVDNIANGQPDENFCFGLRNILGFLKDIARRGEGKKEAQEEAKINERKEEQKAEAKEEKVEVKAEAKAEAKMEAKPETKVEEKEEAKVQDKEDVIEEKEETKGETKEQVKEEKKGEAKEAKETAEADETKAVVKEIVSTEKEAVKKAVQEAKEETKDEAKEELKGPEEVEEGKVEVNEPKEETKTEGMKEEAKAEEPKEEVKTEGVKEEAKAEEPKEEAKTESQ